MIEGKRIAVVMPAYNAAKTLERTVKELPAGVDVRILVDDCSRDDTVRIARRLGLQVVVHETNRGYGANQKTCYREALHFGADIIVMVHPDYQYEPALVTPMAAMIASGICDVVLGSRILGGGALQDGMPLYKYISNRALTAFENLIVGAKLSEYHTGLRAFRRSVIETLPLLENSDDFVFDNELLVQAIHFGFRIGEIPCASRYFAEASTVNFWQGARYGLGVVSTAVKYDLQRGGLARFEIFNPGGRKIESAAVTVPEAELAPEEFEHVT